MRAKITVLILAIFCLVFGIIGISDTVTIMKEDYVDLEASTMGSLKEGDLAKGKIYWAYDKIAVHKTTKSYGFISLGSSEVPYYVIELQDRYMVISAGDKDIQKKLEKLGDETLAYDNGNTTNEPTPVEVTTKVVEMPDKVKQFLKEYCKESGFDDAKYAELVDDSFVINCVDYGSIKMIPFISFGAFVLFAGIFVVLLIRGKKRY